MPASDVSEIAPALPRHPHPEEDQLFLLHIFDYPPEVHHVTAVDGIVESDHQKSPGATCAQGTPLSRHILTTRSRSSNAMIGSKPSARNLWSNSSLTMLSSRKSPSARM